ncbi:creatininase family protein [Oceanobacillus indicireducens]|uniref:Creatinine amidohydrolase n=1 Tax=Oceanobacillus indicireducens TaxID=1004261 RepID=A0A917Y0I8_9BACI|nr:creatininase family protein [Oceanobacillus indicireducens]GGN59646.1 creatinine amidohydrolase [Oceanobacillus indicireducens]
MKSTNLLKEMSWKEFERRKMETDLVIIPSGAFEVYGPHLPLGTDILVSQRISELLAENVNAIIGPALEVGESAMLDEFPGTITIKPESFKAYMNDTVQSLKKWGFKDFLFINTHVGNVPIITQIVDELLRTEDIRCAQVDYWRFLKTLDEGVIETGELAHAHASEAGTSVMMHLYPELCDLDNWINEPPNVENKYPDIHHYPKLSTITKSGTIGNATVATEEKGRELVDRSLDRIKTFLRQSWGYKNENNREDT